MELGNTKTENYEKRVHMDYVGETEKVNASASLLRKRKFPKQFCTFL